MLALNVPDELLKPAGWPVVEVVLGPDMLERIPIEAEPARVIPERPSGDER